jgi:hypothetical protein
MYCSLWRSTHHLHQTAEYQYTALMGLRIWCNLLNAEEKDKEEEEEKVLYKNSQRHVYNFF